MQMIIYLMGSLQNSDEIQEVADQLRHDGHEVYDDWTGHGPDVDLFWQDYEQRRGRSYKEALKGEAARAVFELDKEWLNKSDLGLLVAPAGKSAHMELGYLVGLGKPVHVLMEEEPEKWDLMLRFATEVHRSLPEFLETLLISGGTVPPKRMVPRVVL